MHPQEPVPEAAPQVFNPQLLPSEQLLPQELQGVVLVFSLSLLVRAITVNVPKINRAIMATINIVFILPPELIYFPYFS